MPSVQEREAASRLMALFKEWDNGNKTVRRRILSDFISLNTGKTGPELEQEFSQGSSLFLARLITWLRLSYTFGTCLSEILRAISVYLSATCSNRYKVEFVEFGGVLILLEILTLDQLKEQHKVEALKLLQILASTGRKYKELLCESHGVRVVAECLARAKVEETQEQAQVLLELLAQGNPRYQKQVYKGLIALLPSSSPKAQQSALQTLRVVQMIVGEAHPSITEPLLATLRSLHLEIQREVKGERFLRSEEKPEYNEARPDSSATSPPPTSHAASTAHCIMALQLIMSLMCTRARPDLLRGLVALLRPSRKESAKSRAQILDDPSVPEMRDSLPAYVQQATAAKAISMLARESTEMCDELIELRVIHHLLYVMGNQDHAESQRQASLAVEYFVLSFPVVEEEVRKAIGDHLFQLLLEDADGLYMKINNIQADILRSNQVNIPGVKEIQE